MDMQDPWYIHKSYPEGAVIDDKVMGKLAQVGIRVLLYANSRQELLERMDLVKNTLHVISIENKDMLLGNYSYKEVCNQ